jgi:hypothetical protein
VRIHWELSSDQALLLQSAIDDREVLSFRSHRTDSFVNYHLLQHVCCDQDFTIGANNMMNYLISQVAIEQPLCRSFPGPIFRVACV